MQILLAILVALFQFLPLVGSGDAAATGRALAERADYYVYTIPETNATSVRIAVPLTDESFLALASQPVLKAFTKRALELQSTHLPTDPLTEAEAKPVSLLTPRHLAGELALHVLGYTLTGLAGAEKGFFADAYRRFQYAEMNIDEDRVPVILIDFVGWTVVG
jgi:hypothetical protein